ncbi:MAG: site-specific integrase [Campylobacterota bacterium]|nr:site-specific integrase [Campylobacterota bacterium]
MARPAGTTRAKKPIASSEFKTLLLALDKSSKNKATREKFKKAFTLLYLTGCRVSEIIDFTIEDLKETIKNNEYSLTNKSKTGVARLITFDSNFKQVQMLEHLLPTNIDTLKFKNRYLFYSNHTGKPMSVSSFTLQLNRFIHSVLGELYSTHSFRQGYITIARRLGTPIEIIQKDIAHRSVTTTMRYVDVTTEDIAHSKNSRLWEVA